MSKKCIKIFLTDDSAERRKFELCVYGLLCFFFIIQKFECLFNQYS